MSNEADISKLRIVVESKTDGIVDKLTSLASALDTLKSASRGGFSGLKKCADYLTGLADAVGKIKESDIERLERMSKAIARMSGLKFTTSFFSAMNEWEKKNRGGKVVPYRPYAGYQKDRWQSRGWTWGDNGDYGGGGNGGGGTPFNPVNVFGDPAGLLPGFSADPYIKKWNAMMDNLRHRFDTFKRSILRIATYRLIRRAMMVITQAFGEGLKNAKEWSRINNTQLYQSLKRLSAAGLAMKNALGAALGELLISLEPTLERLSLRIAELGNHLANFFATIRGAGEYQKAITDVNKLAEAQERLNRALLGFDEINKLSGTQDVSDYFTMEKTDKGEAAGTGTMLGILGTFLAGGAIAKGLSTIKTLINGGVGASIFTKLGVLLKNGAAKVGSWFGGGASAAGAGGAGAAGAGASGGATTLGTTLASLAVFAPLTVSALAKLASSIYEANQRKNMPVASDTDSRYSALGLAGGSRTRRYMNEQRLAEIEAEASANPRNLPKTTLDAYWLNQAGDMLGLNNGAAEIVIKEQTPSGYEKEVARFTYGDIINNRVGRIMVNTSMTR